MNRSIYYPLGRATDMDAGGAADLQTDIMRFMAILSLCLVAIFALVQSIPLNPVAPVTPNESATEPVAAQPVEELPSPNTPQPTAAPESVEAQPQTAPPTVREITWRDLIRKPSPAAENTPPKSTQAPVTPAPPPEPAARGLAEAPVPPGTPPAPAPSTPQPEKKTSGASTSVAEETITDEAASEGFTLRFESNIALTRLVARNEIGLYAISQQRALRMNVNRGAYTFWPASAPNQFHEMEPGTVPNEVVTALRRSGSLGLAPEVKWGVTLPPKMRGQLDGYLAEHTGGALVIEGDGNLRLEQ